VAKFWPRLLTTVTIEVGDTGGERGRPLGDGGQRNDGKTVGAIEQRVVSSHAA
jgi:hypothetical protein